MATENDIPAAPAAPEATGKINFYSDYNTVGHPLIVEALQAHLGEKYVGYGLDEACERAQQLMLGLIWRPQTEAGSQVSTFSGATVSARSQAGVSSNASALSQANIHPVAGASSAATAPSDASTSSDATAPSDASTSSDATAPSAATTPSDATTPSKTRVITLPITYPQPEVHFMVGGTQANLIAISAFLRPHEAVIAPYFGHVSLHETGAIEATGHKVLTIASGDGKARPDDVIKIIREHTNEHMVKPRLLYISQSTEFGTVYTREELYALRKTCLENSLLFYIDGARLGYALASGRCRLGLPEIAELVDAFYIGGTKSGLLFGEALYICNPELAKDFRFLIKQRGGMLAKGFLLGIQFEALFKNNLYFKLAQQANEMAAQLTKGLQSLGYSFEIETETNQVFPILKDYEIPRLAKHIEFNEWHHLEGGQTSIRFVTTWETTTDEIEATLKLMA